jgi:hypothetical protein
MAFAACFAIGRSIMAIQERLLKLPAVRAAALFVPDHLQETYVCAYHSLLNFVRAQAKR